MLTADEARARLSPFVPTVFVAPFAAAAANWREYVTDKPDLAVAMDETARAGMIHCWVRREVRSALGKAEGIREITALEFFAVAVGTDPIVRFKFVGSGRPQNVATDRQKRLTRHQYDDEDLAALAIEGIPSPPTILTCGYVLDAADEIDAIRIRCDYRGELVWEWSIFGDEGEGGATVEPMPLPNVPGPQPAAVRSTRARRNTGRSEGEGSP